MGLRASIDCSDNKKGSNVVQNLDDCKNQDEELGQGDHIWLSCLSPKGSSKKYLRIFGPMQSKQAI